MNKLLYSGESSYGRYRVVEQIHDGRPARLLLSGGAAPQSGVALDDDPELLFDYNQRFLEIALGLMPKSILMIGGGAFTLPTTLIERFSDVKVTVVEIDPLLPHLAREYFDLPDNSRLTVVTEDGRKYIDTCRSRYDLIIIDAFEAYEVPRSLFTIQAAAQYAHLVAPHGTVALNFIAAYYRRYPTLAHRLLATFRKVFASVDLYPSDPHYPKQEDQNYVLVASHSTPHLDYMQSVRVESIGLVDERLVLNDEKQG